MRNSPRTPSPFKRGLLAGGVALLSLGAGACSSQDCPESAQATQSNSVVSTPSPSTTATVKERVSSTAPTDDLAEARYKEINTDIRKGDLEGAKEVLDQMHGGDGVVADRNKDGKVTTAWGEGRDDLAEAHQN